MKNKILTILAPTILGAATIVPMCTMTSCNKDNSIAINSGNSITYWEYKLSEDMAGETVKVSIKSQPENQEQVALYNSTGTVTQLDLIVDDDGKISIPVGFAYYAPAKSSSSVFDLNIVTGSSTNNETTKVVTGKFNYVVDYAEDIKGGDYVSPIDAAKASHWTEGGATVGAMYMSDVENKPEIFQTDARYSTSLNIKTALDAQKIKGLTSFKAYFNDVYKDDNGLGVHMNYEIKGTNGGEFSFTVASEEDGSSYTYTFKNFDVSVSLATQNGYVFTQDTTTKNMFLLSDPEASYNLIGRFNGKFDCTVVDSTQYVHCNKTGVEWDDVINDEQQVEAWSAKDLAQMFTAGIIHLTYNFDWGTETPSLKIISSYAKNAQ